jgi:hypothetical protein
MHLRRNKLRVNTTEGGYVSSELHGCIVSLSHGWIVSLLFRLNGSD